MTAEVRYERLRPAQIRAAREACPVAYLPIGTIEWHGVHNPIGLDTVKAHALCVRCAEANGGLVFPALFYGENRENALLESSCGCTEPISEAMGLDPENFRPGYMMRSIAEQDQMYHQLLIHILHQIKSLGFKVCVICAGHYPLIDHAKAAAHIFHQHTHHEYSSPKKMLVWVFSGYELVKEKYDYAGDHAAFWEPSLMLALQDSPMVDLAELPEDPQKVIGVGGLRPPHEATAEIGEKHVREIVEIVGKKVDERLAVPNPFSMHNLTF